MHKERPKLLTLNRETLGLANGGDTAGTNDSACATGGVQTNNTCTTVVWTIKPTG